MIRIWKGSKISIERQDYNRDQILEEYQSFNCHRDKKFIIYENNTISSILDYRDILLKRAVSIKGNLIRNTENLMEQARSYFSKIENLYSGSCLGVIDEEGNLEFILEYFDNSNFIDHEQHPHFYKWLYRDQMKYLYNIKKFHHIFDDYQVFLFQSVEEYTIALINLLLEKHVNMEHLKVYCLDANARKFFHEDKVTIITQISEMKEVEKYMMLISERYKESNYPSSKVRKTYTSVEVMMKLYEEQIARELNPHTKKPFIIYNDSMKGSGMVDIMKFSIANMKLAEYKGQIPVINISDNIVYSDGEGENIWEYYFDSFDAYSLDQAYASRNCIVSSKRFWEMYQTQIEEMKKYNIQYDLLEELRRLHWKSEIIEYCESEIPQPFKENKRILGVIARGTDYNAPAVIQRRGVDNIKNVNVEKVIEVIKRKMEAEKYDYIYLATEDLYNYQEFVKEFGDKVISTKQERIDLIKNKQFVKEIVANIPKEKEKFEYGLDYLVVLTCLARCESLVTSVFCGAYVAAKALNNNQYKNIMLLQLR